MIRILIFLALFATLGAKEFQITAIAAKVNGHAITKKEVETCLLYTSPSPRDLSTSRMPSSA